MASPNKLNLSTTLIDTFHESFKQRGYEKYDVGFELELEGELAPVAAVLPEVNWWTSKNDTSLRNGMEYVLYRPVTKDEFVLATKELASSFKHMKPKTSIRTSTHIHINVLNFTIQQIYQAAFAYYLIEELLIKTQPKERIGNLFCLRMSDAATIPWAIEKSIRTKKYFNFFYEDYYKYSALNFCTVSRYGSLEFRLFQAMMPDQFDKWVTTCFDLINNGKNYHPSELLDAYDDLPVKKFLRQLLPNSGWLYDDKSSEYLNECLHTNYDRLRDLARTFGKEVYEIPQPMWVEDTDVNTASLRYQVQALGLNPDDYVPEPFPDLDYD